MRVRAFMITASDVRYFEVEAGFTYGHYLELDRPYPENRRNNLCVIRTPVGFTAPLGRLPADVLQALGEQASLPEAEPQVIARYPHWSYIVQNGVPFEVGPGGSVYIDDGHVIIEDVGITVEPVAIYPPSEREGTGRYVQPRNAFKPIPAAAETPATPPESGEKAPRAARTGKQA